MQNMYKNSYKILNAKHVWTENSVECNSLQFYSKVETTI